MPFTDVENQDLSDSSQQSQNSFNEKLDVFLDKLIDNPVARNLSQFVKLCCYNNKILIRSLFNYATFKTVLSCTGCMPQNSLEIDNQKCLFTNKEDPLLRDDELLNLSITTLALNIAFTVAFAYARMAIIKRGGRDLFDDTPILTPINQGGEEVVRSESRVQMFDLAPSYCGSFSVFFFSLINRKNPPIDFGTLLLNFSSNSFYCDKFLTLPKNQFMAIMENKPPEPSILSQSPDLQELQASISNRDRMGEQLPRIDVSMVFANQRQPNQPQL